VGGRDRTGQDLGWDRSPGQALHCALRAGQAGGRADLEETPPKTFRSKCEQGHCLQQEQVPGPQGEGEQQATLALGSPVCR